MACDAARGAAIWPRLMDRWLLLAVDLGLAAAIFLVPLAMGGRAALGNFILAILMLWVAACWCVRQSLLPRATWCWSWVELVVLVTVALMLLQVEPLSPAVLKGCSPHLFDRLPLWSPDTNPAARLGVWPCLSLTPDATRSGLVLLASYAILFLVTVQRARGLAEIERFLRWMAMAGSAMAAFGLIQHLFGNGKYFWCYEYPFTNSIGAITGSFANRNHFAHFVVLAIGPLTWWIQSRWTDLAPGDGRSPRVGKRAGSVDASAGFLLLALGICVFAVLLSQSRGAAAVMFLAAGVCLLMLHRGSLMDKKVLLSVVGVGALVGILLGIFGYKSVSSRLGDLKSVDRLDLGFARRNLWRANLAGIAEFALAGTGVGSHSQVYPMYLPADADYQHTEFTHAENGYLQIGLEGGISALVILSAMIGLCAVWCVVPLLMELSCRSHRCLAAIIPSLAASATHSLTDFIWYVPGCVIIVLVLAACACRLRQISSNRAASSHGIPVPRAAWGAALIGLGFCGSGMVSQTLADVRAEPHWHRFVVASRALLHSDQATGHDRLNSMAQELTEVIRWQPENAVAHARLAEVQIRLFDDAQDAAIAVCARQVRQSAMASSSHFQSSADLQAWLTRAFGARQQHLRMALNHAQRAVFQCPLQADAYLSLAVVGFLRGPRSIPADAYVKQALQVRPFDGTVLFACGQEAILAGNFDQGLTLWRKSFACGSYHQQRLVNLLADQAPPHFFLQAFDMDLSAIRLLETRYRELHLPDSAQALLKPRAETARRQALQAEPTAAVLAWLDAAEAHHQLGETRDCLDCLRHAVQSDGSNYDARFRLGEGLRRRSSLPQPEST